MLIRRAEIWGQALADVRVEGDRVVAIGQLDPADGEAVVDAEGAALLPGLHDHHIHLAALAAKAASVECGPPDVEDEAALAAALTRPGNGWLRGIGYHESTAGMLDRDALDRIVPDRPVRIQHRSGRMWFFNSQALDLLLIQAAPPEGLDLTTGRLFDDDAWLRRALISVPPGFGTVSAALAAMGVTGLTDMTPANDVAAATHFRAEQAAGHLVQRVALAGTLALDKAEYDATMMRGPAKLHLHEARFPDLDDTIAFVRAAHDQGRGVAVHCTTEAELVFALSVFESAGTVTGDRIEHAGVSPDPLIAEMARMRLWAVSQPHFITERGDAYARDVAPRDLPVLYRLRGFLDAGVVLAAGSDAPFGRPDPWAAMAAAVSRATRDGRTIGRDEALTPEQALGLFLGDPLDLTRDRRIEIGVPADLCLLDRSWASARTGLSAADVRLTMIAGRVVHDRIDQAPAECGARVDAAA